MEPFWGKVTSNVDWCEPNYSHTHYIAEFYNTMSSVPMIWMGLIGMIESRRIGLPRHFALSFFALMIVGIGSVMFHASLVYSAQLADELPMILGSLVFVYMMRDIVFPSTNGRFWMPEWMTAAMLIGYGVLTSLFMALWTHSPLPMNISYMLVVFFIIFAAIKTYRSATQPISRRIFELAIASYFFGSGCWLVEKYFCEAAMPISQYLHAVWHLTAGFGTYAFLQWTTYVKAHALHIHPRLAIRALLPMVTADVAKQKAAYTGPITRSQVKQSM